MFPDGRAARLMGDIQFPCAHCGGAVREPLTLAATRHARSPRAVHRGVPGARRCRPDRGAARRRAPAAPAPVTTAPVRCSARGRRRGAHDVGRALARAFRGRGAPSRRGAVHRRPRAGAARLARGDRPLAARARAGGRRRDRRARGRRRARRPDRRGRRPPLEAVPARESSRRVPHYAAAAGTARYVGEPLAVVVARDRYVAEDAAELVAVDYEPLDPVLDPLEAPAIHDRSFHYGDVDEALARADLVVRETFRVPRFTCMPVECYGVVCDWDEAGGRLTAWANFQGPFTLHGVAAAALGLRGDRLRLLTPPDSGGSFGIKAAVLPYVVLIGLASRALGVPVRWTEDRLEHLAASSASTGRVTRSRRASRTTASSSRSATTRSRTSARTSAHPSPRRSTGCTARSRARTASANVAARNRVVLTNTAPVGAQPRVRRAAALLRPRARRWRSPRAVSGSTRPSSHGGTSFPPTRCRTGRRRARSTTRATTRRASTARSSWRGYDELRDRVARARARAGVCRRRARVRRRAVDLEHGVHHARPDGGRARGPLPKSGNAEGASVAIDPLGGITVRLGTTPQGQGHRTVCAQVVADELGCAPEDVTVLSELDTQTTPWTVASGNYSSRFSGVGVGAVQTAARTRARRRSTRSASTSATRSCRCARSPGWPTGTRRGFRTAWSRASPRSRSGRRRTSTRRMPRTASRRPARTASSSTSARSRSTRETGARRAWSTT